MGKPTGFLEYERQENEAIQPLSRITNFNEFHPFLDEETRRKQGARCMNCGVPFCQSAIKLKNMVTGCPLHNLIPEWNDEIYNGNDKRALSRLLKTNPFPEFTGRVCPALCEKACLNSLDQEPVTIKENELYTIETAYTNNWMTPYVPSVRSDKKVAIIGSGPAGLALAHDLNRRGHSVTVFEKEDRIGGLLMYGIPNMKLEKKVIQRRLEILSEEGIVFKTNVNVGKDITKKELEKEYDAIVFATGSKKARDLNVKNRDCTGIYFAVDYLTKATKHLLDNTEEISAKYKHVVIVGGGDDCVGTSIRQGCASVVQIEMMPKTPDERLQSNPWPEWPKICKTDYGQEEAIAVFKKDPRIYETTVKECILDEKKNLKQIKTVKVHFNNGKLEEVKGSEQILDCDLLLIAAGFIGVEDDLKKSFKLETTQRNTIVTQPNSYQVKDKYFTAGDCHRGQSLVVWAIHEGKECAKEVDTYLMGYTNMG
jgi:glutamate synthase (NADPH/NADH) small chain